LTDFPLSSNSPRFYDKRRKWKTANVPTGTRPRWLQGYPIQRPQNRTPAGVNGNLGNTLVRRHRLIPLAKAPTASRLAISVEADPGRLSRGTTARRLATHDQTFESAPRGGVASREALSFIKGGHAALSPPPCVQRPASVASAK